MIDDHKVKALPAKARAAVHDFLSAVEAALETEVNTDMENAGIKVEQVFTRYGEGGWVLANVSVRLDPTALTPDFAEYHNLDDGPHKAVQDWALAESDLELVKAGEYLDFDDGKRTGEEFEANARERLANALERMQKG